MKIYQYSNYDEYKEAQVEANKIKIDNIWVSELTIREIFVKHGPAQKILCHGTRNAAEQKFFKKYYNNSLIIGTEISDNAGNFDMTVEWDFHKQNPDWLSIFDIIYTNSLDHSYDPVLALTTWSGQLSNKGRLYIEFCFDNKSRKWDPLEISKYELIELCKKINLEMINSFLSFSHDRKSEVLIFQKNASV